MKIPFKMILKVLGIIDGLLHLLIKGVAAVENLVEGVVNADQ